MAGASIMNRRAFVGVICGIVGAGCVSDDEANGASEGERTTPACSNGSIDSVNLKALTSGDTIVVRGTVEDLPVPALRGFVVNTEGGEETRDEISVSLGETGEFSREFRYPHHAIVDYAFWFRGCPETTPTPETDR